MGDPQKDKQDAKAAMANLLFLIGFGFITLGLLGFSLPAMIGDTLHLRPEMVRIMAGLAIFIGITDIVLAKFFQKRKPL